VWLVRASSAAARLGEQRRGSPQATRQQGVFFFGFFLLDKQKKEARQSGETDGFHTI